MSTDRIPYTSAVDAMAVPMIGVSRIDFLKAIEKEGWRLGLDGPTGLYYHDPHNPHRALWVSWEWDQDGRKEWFTQVLNVGPNDKL